MKWLKLLLKIYYFFILNLMIEILILLLFWWIPWNLSNFQVKCGFATVHDVKDYSLEDRMESFFLAETMKYLYLVS